MKQPEDNKTLDLFFRDNEAEIKEIIQKIAASLRTEETLSNGVINYGHIRRASKRLNDALDVDFRNIEHRILGIKPTFIIVDEIAVMEAMNCTLSEVRIDNDIFQMGLTERFGYMIEPTLTCPDKEPKQKKAKWKQDKSPFGRLNQSRKAKGL